MDHFYFPHVTPGTGGTTETFHHIFTQVDHIITIFNTCIRFHFVTLALSEFWNVCIAYNPVLNVFRGNENFSSRGQSILVYMGFRARQHQRSLAPIMNDFL